MKILSTKTLRTLLQRVLFFLPASRRITLDRWLRGRKEFRKLQRADIVVVSLPKSGRTWLRVMLSRFFQQRFNLEADSVLGFDNFNKLNNAIPKIFFTHDNVLRDYSGRINTKQDFYGKKIILLTRDPRDVAVSGYHQWAHRMSEEKRKLYYGLDTKDVNSIFEFVMNAPYGIPYNIAFLNSWEKELGRISDILIVRYEDMRSAPQDTLSKILEFMNTAPQPHEIDDVVTYADFKNMRKLEQKQAFQTSSQRLFAQDTNKPNTLKTRRAKVGGFRDYFTEEQIAKIDNLIDKELSPSFGYHSQA